MASLSSLYIKIETLKTLVDTLEKKNEKGVELTVSVNDEPNKYEQNVSAWVSQTKEQREQGKPRYYVGNGKTFWSSNGKPAAPAVEAKVVNDDLPF
jgi:hypothetical protein